MLAELSFPPGLYANGTINQARGRWHDANLVRFRAGAIHPWGGWVSHSASALTGSARAMLTWVDNSAAKWIGIGTHSGLFVMNRLGVLIDITPVGFMAGVAEATVGGGYGQGNYGAGDYGESGGDAELIQPATTWSLDTFGELLVGCSDADGVLYAWNLDTGDAATAIAGAPANCRSLVVTEEGFLFALGAAGDGRLVQWADQQDIGQWTPGLPSQAGSFPLQTGGRLMCGKRTRGATLLFTDQDVHLASFLGGANPFGFDKIGDGCGVISQGAAVAAGTTLVAWMGQDGFWIYDGDVQPLACDVQDRVFSNINSARLSHVTGYHRARSGEIVWHYCSAGATENDCYAAWNYRENHWTTGTLSRLCGTDQGAAFPYPLAIDAAGTVWRHETGFDYAGAAQPYLESGPFQIGGADRVFTVLSLIPDERVLGQVEATFHGRFHPTDAETTFGPFTLANPTDVRFTARHARLRLTGAAGVDWRIGGFKLDIVEGGAR